MRASAAMGETALILLSLILSSQLFEASEETVLASTPPRGWNSYDSFSWVVDEQAFMHNAKIVASLLRPHGYEYVVVDFLWYRKNVDGAFVDSYGYDNIDIWGRPIPDPDRWPSSRGGNGFKGVAQRVHNMGLKFGIHLMRGISTQSVQANTPILDVFKGGRYEEGSQQRTARDIGMTNMTCKWMQHGFMSVDTNLGAGRAFLRSLYRQYADWGVDFVKLDCIFGDDLDSEEIITVSKLLEELDRPVLFSLSPGTRVTPSMASGISNHVNMYRITSDDWDKWEDVASHFDVSRSVNCLLHYLFLPKVHFEHNRLLFRDFAASNKIGAVGLQGRSWPDLDMLPLGWLTDPGVRQGPHRECNLTLDEQMTQMTLWSMVKSPLMFGGDLRHIHESTLNIITQPTLLEINSYSQHNKEIWGSTDYGRRLNNFFGLSASLYSKKANVISSGIRAWVATGRNGEIYLSFFNLSSTKLLITARIWDLAGVLPRQFLRTGSCNCTEVWSGKKLGVVKYLSIIVNKHGCALFVLNCM